MLDAITTIQMQELSVFTVGGKKQERIIDYQVRDEPPKVGSPSAMHTFFDAMLRASHAITPREEAR